MTLIAILNSSNTKDAAKFGQGECRMFYTGWRFNTLRPTNETYGYHYKNTPFRHRRFWFCLDEVLDEAPALFLAFSYSGVYILYHKLL